MELRVESGAGREARKAAERPTKPSSAIGQGAAKALFDFAEPCVRRMRALVGETSLLSPRCFHLDSVEKSTGRDGLFGLLAEVEHSYPLELRAPFEGVSSIAGGLWTGADLVGHDRVDGFAKLRFDAGTVDLPMHAHEHSDRFIIVLEGEGIFYLSPQPLDVFVGQDVRSIRVRQGDALMFTRGLMHTFGAWSEPLVLLSYHSPVIGFDDPRQYTLPAVCCTPRTMRDCAA